MYVVKNAKDALGVKVNEFEVVDTVPVTPPETVMLEVVSVFWFIVSLKVTVMVVELATPVADKAGLRVEMVGTTESSTYIREVVEQGDALPAGSVALA